MVYNLFRINNNQENNEQRRIKRLYNFAIRRNED